MEHKDGAFSILPDEVVEEILARNLSDKKQQADNLKTLASLALCSSRFNQVIKQPFITPKIRYSIAEILIAEYKEESLGNNLIVGGSITGVETSVRWFYFACKKCMDMVSTVSGLYMCKSCGYISMYPLIKFSLVLHIEDRSGEIPVILSDVLSEKLVGCSAKAVVKKMEWGPDVLPPELLALKGRSFNFQISLNRYEHRFDNFMEEGMGCNRRPKVYKLGYILFTAQGFFPDNSIEYKNSEHYVPNQVLVRIEGYFSKRLGASKDETR